MKCDFIGCKNQAVYKRTTVFKSGCKNQVTCVCEKHATNKDKSLSTWQGTILGAEFTTSVKFIG